jgi:hypothetical protein
MPEEEVTDSDVGLPGEDEEGMMPLDEDAGEEVETLEKS